ncbi:MAG: L-fucose mutarotase [Bacteroidia bacterium]
MPTQRHCYALDLRDDPDLIAQYRQHHAPGQVWPAVIERIRAAGIVDMQIYLSGNRLMMIMETDERFDPQTKAAMDAANPDVQAWEALMSQFQQALPWAAPGQKWVPMEQIFQLGA